MTSQQIVEACRRRAAHWRRAQRLWTEAGNSFAARECAREAERCERQAAQIVS